jgi:hypothetical protein
MGHAEVATKLSIYTQLFVDGNAETMAALGAMGRPLAAANVLPMRRR